MADPVDRLGQALRAKLGPDFDDFTQDDLRLLVSARYTERNVSKASREGLTAAGLGPGLVDVLLRAYQGERNQNCCMDLAVTFADLRITLPFSAASTHVLMDLRLDKQKQRQQGLPGPFGRQLGKSSLIQTDKGVSWAWRLVSRPVRTPPARPALGVLEQMLLLPKGFMHGMKGADADAWLN
jgi:hypothetical protein